MPRISLFATSLIYFGVKYSAQNVNADSNATYWNHRKALMSEDASQMLGSDIRLNAEEEVANEVLMNFKEVEFSKGYERPMTFLPSNSFFRSKTLIERSQVFKFIKSMPKGAVLHIHDSAMVSTDWIIRNLTYWDDLYMCNATDGHVLFKFFDVPDLTCEWKLVTEERKKISSSQHFDHYLYGLFSLYTPFPEARYPSINIVWKAFENAIVSLEGIIRYRKAFEAFLNQSFLEAMNDGVTYIEIRSTLPLLYEKDGREYSLDETAAIYKDVTDRFTAEHAGFHGSRCIYSPERRVDLSVVWGYVDNVIRLRNLFPTFIAGFDLVGQEDLGYSLIELIDPLLNLSRQNPPVPVFYHAGETDWEGMASDENIFDALLLNVTRIGHGYAISKHPSLVQKAIQMDVPIEVAPLSNQILMLIKDLRNHPAASLVSKSFPLVVSSDDPSLFGALPLSHDFYEAFMAIGGAKADLRFLKKLALNSIRYSSLSSKQKVALGILWKSQWKKFILKYATGAESLRVLRVRESDHYEKDHKNIILV